MKQKMKIVSELRDILCNVHEDYNQYERYYTKEHYFLEKFQCK